MRIDAAALASELGLPVVATVATRGAGLEPLRAATRSAPIPRFPLDYRRKSKRRSTG